MLDMKFIRENPDLVKAGAQKKHIACDVDAILELDQNRREMLQKIESLRSERKNLSKAGGAGGDDIRQKALEIKNTLAELEPKLDQVEKQLRHQILLVPNIPDPRVPEGETDQDNVLVRTWGEIPKFDFEPKDHFELGKALRLFDFERGANISGSRFYFLRGYGALLEIAVLRYSIDLLMSRGFEPFIVPMLVRPTAMEGTGFLPRGEEEAYYMERDDLYLIGTSEVSLASFHMKEILEKEQLPLHYAGISSCFRREAGSLGKDTKGLYRVHQFQKIEQIVVCQNDPAESERQHHFILNNAELLLQGLNIPHRVMMACGGECGIPQVMKHEVESYMPSRHNYCETQSCSTIHDFQARRLNIRYRDDHDNLVFAHTLNNTAVASPRILIPILELNQQKDGSVVVPKALVKYMNGIEVLEPKK
jgi:seryl-tRNA synthetase